MTASETIDCHVRDHVEFVNTTKETLFKEFAKDLLGECSEEDLYKLASGSTLFSQSQNGDMEAKVWFVFDHGQHLPELWKQHANAYSKTIILTCSH